MKNLALHWKILIGMVLGVLFGMGMTQWDSSTTPEIHEGVKFVNDWIAPIGTIFINLLKLIAIPLILASLIKGIADLGDITKFSQIGGRTIGIYLITTIIAVSIGLTVVNVIQPGADISQETLDKLISAHNNDASAVANVNKKMATAQSQKGSGPLAFVVDIVPNNIFKATTDNGKMLQVIFFALFFGISLLLIDREKSVYVKGFFDGLNEVILKMVDLIMIIAPYAVFALLAGVIVSAGDPEILVELIKYSFTVLLGLLSMIVF